MKSCMEDDGANGVGVLFFFAMLVLMLDQSVVLIPKDTLFCKVMKLAILS